MAQYCYDYPRPSVTTDICLFTVVEDDLRILLIRRGLEPFKGAWALPGGFLQETETLDQCAARELIPIRIGHDSGRLHKSSAN